MQSATYQHFYRNVMQLLTVESNTERERSKNHEALVHAGKMAAVGRMVAGINHEIKRPLASMRLLTESALDLIASGDHEAAAANLQMLLRATDQMTELTRQLEGFSRKAPLNKAVIPLKQAVDDARMVLSPKLKSGKNIVHCRIDALHVLADLDRLTLALVNLIDNAMDATVEAHDKRIDVEAEQEDDRIAVRVRDYGRGIPADAMDKIFESFFTTKPVGAGLGLGLALSAEVIHEMGGQLSARNHPEGGAEFTIHLPLAH